MQTGANQGDPLPNIFGNPDAKHVNLDETADEALAAVLASLESSGTASVSIYRQGPGGYRDVTFLTECMPAEYSLARLQDDYGGGVFRVHVREGGKLVANKEVKVAPRPGRQSASDDAIAPIQAQISALTGAVQKLVELQAQPARREDNEDALLDRMIKYKQIFGGGAPTQQSDPFETVTKMLQLASQVNKMTGNAPPEPPDGLSLLASTAKEVLPLFAQAAAQRQHVASMRAPVADRAPPAVAENPLPAPVASAPQPQPQQDEANMLKMYIGILLKDAQQDLDPTGWAHMIVNHVAPHDIEALLRPDTWFDQLSTFEPKVAPFREWFTELREMVFELLSGEGGTGTTGENSSGGTNHASGGGTSSNTEGHS